MHSCLCYRNVSLLKLGFPCIFVLLSLYLASNPMWAAVNFAAKRWQDQKIININTEFRQVGKSEGRSVIAQKVRSQPVGQKDMPRQSRIDAPGALHHVIARGIERREIFRDDEDRDDFLRRLGDIIVESKTLCYAWALIPNHFHILLKTGEVPIATVMRRLLSGYAAGFNRKRRRSGHLFQNRYKSILCQEDAYLSELVRYIHLNPLRAGIVNTLEELDHTLTAATPV
jgi:REP element-mobilizing transposase RayT